MLGMATRAFSLLLGASLVAWIRYATNYCPRGHRKERLRFGVLGISASPGLAGHQVLSFGEKELPKLSKYFHIIIIISMSFITFIVFGRFTSSHCFGYDRAKGVLSIPLVVTTHCAILK